jgi:hypothetical protein
MQLNDYEINNIEDIEDLLVKQQDEEFDLVSKHLTVESEARVAFQRQKSQMEALQLLDRLKVASSQVARQQRRQNRHMQKALKVSSRQRERVSVFFFFCFFFLLFFRDFDRWLHVSDLFLLCHHQK